MWSVTEDYGHLCGDIIVLPAEGVDLPLSQLLTFTRQVSTTRGQKVGGASSDGALVIM